MAIKSKSKPCLHLDLNISTLVNTATISLPSFESSRATTKPWDIGTVAWRLEGINFAVRSFSPHLHRLQHGYPRDSNAR